MAIDARKNFAKGPLSTGYDASATSIVLATGHGARFPAVPFNATWWNSTDYPNPADDPNVEIIRVTALASDTLTVTRAQESTAASTKNTAGKTYLLLAGPTKKTIDDIETDIAARETPAGAQSKADAAQAAAIAAAATDATTKANAAQAAAIQRANHTGTQAISTVTGLQTALDGKQPLATVLTNTTASFTTAQEAKLAGIATGATANDTDANLKNRANHTGEQSADTITDGTTNKAYTAAEQTKLAGIDPKASAKKVVILTLGDGTNAITTGYKGHVRIPWACTITKSTLLADVSGSIVLDVWKDTYANFPPTVADTITASAKPTLSSAQKAEDATLTGWTTSIAAGDVIGVNVDSVATVKRVVLELELTLT